MSAICIKYNITISQFISNPPILWFCFEKMLRRNIRQPSSVSGLALLFGALLLVWHGQSWLAFTAVLPPKDIKSTTVGLQKVKASAPVLPKKVNARKVVLPHEGVEQVMACNTSVQPCLAADSGSPLIYFVTPTYPRREQAAELTRLAQTLLHVPNLHWVLAEDASDCSDRIPSLMRRYRIPFTYVASPGPAKYKRLPKLEIPRGVSSRRAALKMILAWHEQSACLDQQAGK